MPRPDCGQECACPSRVHHWATGELKQRLEGLGGGPIPTHAEIYSALMFAIDQDTEAGIY